MPARPDYRVCVELMPPAELARPSVVKLLCRHGVAPMLAVHPGSDGAALHALRPYLDAGVAACAWPLLSDAEGYWPGLSNVAAFAARVSALLAAARREQMRLPWLAIDLEPRLDQVTRLRRGSLLSIAPSLVDHALRRRGRADLPAAAAAYAALHKQMASDGTRGVAIAYPVVATDFAAGASRVTMQAMCEAPLRCGWDRVAIMTYGSMISGYSRGALTVEDARFYGYLAVADLAGALGRRAGAFVGVVGKGKLGDEPAYDDPAELSRDVAAALAAGAGEISLFCLEGVLGARHPEAWLRALVDAEPARPPRRWRGALLHRSMAAGAALLRALGG